MPFPSVRRLLRRNQRDRDPRFIDGGAVKPMQPWTAEDGVREVRHYTVQAGRRDDKPGHGQSERGQRDVLSGGLLWLAGLVIAASLVGAGYVAYEAQRLFALAHLAGTDREARAQIIAALPDAGWGAMALVALVAALRGRSSARARLGVVVFFGLSLGAQLMYAPRTVEGYLVAVIAPITLAWMLESFVVEVRRWASHRRGLDLDESPILTGVLRAVVRVPVAGFRLGLWFVRLSFDRRGTWGGIREWVLDEAPLAPGRTAASLRAAAAIEQAGSAQQEAQQIKAVALAEAERITAQARQEAEETRAAAAEQVEQARREAAEAVEQARQDAARAAEQARTAAAEQVDAMESQTHEQLSAVRAEATAAVEQARREAAERMEQLRADYELRLQQHTVTMTADRRAAEEARARVERQNEQLAGELARVRDEYERVLAASPGKTRLIALYEQLRDKGDPRYMDRDRVAEVARELYQEAGLQSEGTARNYLYEHVDIAAKRTGVAA